MHAYKSSNFELHLCPIYNELFSLAQNTNWNAQKRED